jgi:hypothetical protein
MSINRVDSGRSTPEKQAELKRIEKERLARFEEAVETTEIDWDVEKVSSESEAIRGHREFCDRDMAQEDPRSAGGRRR